MTHVIHLPPAQAWTFARLPKLLDDHDIYTREVLHVGAHHGEEVPIYRQCGFERITLVEPDPGNHDILVQRFGVDPDITLVHAAATTVARGTVALHRAARSVWSGLNPHPTATGETVPVDTVPITTLVTPTVNVIVLDTQGSEQELLEFTPLGRLDVIIIETTRRRGDTAAFYDTTHAYLRDRGFFVAEEWVHDNSGYTDTVFINSWLQA